MWCLWGNKVVCHFLRLKDILPLNIFENSSSPFKRGSLASGRIMNCGKKPWFKLQNFMQRHKEKELIWYLSMHFYFPMQVTTEECFSNEFSFVHRIKLPRLKDLFCYGNGLFLATHNGDVTLITKINCKPIHVFDFWIRSCCFSLHLEKFQRKVLC